MIDEQDTREFYHQTRKWWRSPRLQRDLPKLFASLASQYGRDKNPRHAWEAYGLARAASVPVPGWVLAYFDRVAETMHVLNQHPPTERRIAAAAARALELPTGGRRNPFRAWPDENHQEWIASEVQDRLDEGQKLYLAAEEIGGLHPTPLCKQLFPQCRKALSRATVEAYYKRSDRNTRL
jgi:hypothetical protein